MKLFQYFESTRHFKVENGRDYKHYIEVTTKHEPFWKV
jgi:hypothetical protein